MRGWAFGLSSQRSSWSVAAIIQLAQCTETEESLIRLRLMEHAAEILTQPGSLGFLAVLYTLHGPELLRWVDSDTYKKIKSDPRWRELQDKHGYSKDPVEDIEFDFMLPASASFETA